MRFSFNPAIPAVNAMMPDKKHTMLSIELPVSLTEDNSENFIQRLTAR